jgi:SAM-dependent methyltransferase
MQKQLSNELWQDSQKNELWFWQTMLDQGNPDQHHRNAYYQSNMEGKCDMIKRFLDSNDLSGRVILDLGSGPEGFCHAINAGIKIAIDPLMNKFRRMGFKTDANKVVSITAKAEDLSDMFYGTFDVIFCLNSIDHHQDPGLVMDQIFDALKPHGHAFILTDLRPPELCDAYHKLPLTREDMDEWAWKFEVVETQIFPHGPGNPLMQYIMHLQKS